MKRHLNGRNAITSHVFAFLIGSFLRIIDGYDCNLGSLVALQPEVGDSGTINSANYPSAYPMLRDFCHVDFHICPGCILDVRFDDVDLNPCPRDYMFAVEDTHQGHLAKNNGSLCEFADQCDYIVWWSKDEGLRQLGGHLTGTVITSHTSSPSPWLHFCYSDIPTSPRHVKRWKIDFIVNDQYTYRIHGSAINDEDSSDRLHQGVLRSTGFPYMTNEQTSEYTYLLQGQLDSDRIILGFDDFYIDAEHSLVTIYDGSIVNRSLHHLAYSGFIHPPQFWSSSPYLLLHYTAGKSTTDSESHKSQWGFKASYRFINKNRFLREEKIITDCEQINLYSGGVLVQNGGPETRIYDCVWPLPCLPQHASSITLLNVTLPEGGDTRLEVKNAYHSDGKILTELSSSDLDQLHTVSLESDNGLYVRLQGPLGPDHQVSFSYTIFKPLSESTVKANKGCSIWVKWQIEKGFVCQATMRCIPQRLLCDSAPHCGNMEDETSPCHLPQRDITPLAWRNSTTCHYPMIFCGEGRCVNHAAHCRIHPAKNCWGPWNIPCDNKHKCYRIEEKCDKANQCGDNTDEHDCLSEMAHSLSNVWYFFLPIVLLMLTFAGGCVVYKTRKIRSQYRAGQVVSLDNIQLHTFPGVSGAVQPVAPPSYDDVIASPDTYIPANTKEETEPLITPKFAKKLTIDEEEDEEEVEIVI